MKNKYPLVVLLFLILFSACEKEDNTPASQLEGKWTLIATTGGLSGQGTPITSKQTAIFQGGTYKLLVDDLQLNADTYRIEQVGGNGNGSWQLKIGNREVYIIHIKDGLLHLNSPDPDALELIYKKAL